MYRRISLAALLALFTLNVFAQKAPSADDQAVRQVITAWDTAYRSLDPKAMADTVADEFEIVDRFGKITSPVSRGEYIKMWAWAFKNVYNGSPGPKHDIGSMRFIDPNVAMVHATATRKEPVVLPDGKKIPPFTQHVTFVVVKRKNKWRITSQSIHNQFSDPHAAEKLPWRDGKGS